ncbi:MAG TPA: hypothetical protein VGN64_18005 [Dyadobacter sp.]|jgi:outer membrane protein assembly factor BamE (lipoprotein component of BamABCDE complex)|nr:hypothetical protein [Dyadobacter sp.]
MKIKGVVVLLISLWLSGCVTNNVAYRTNERMKQVNIGMTKSEVIGILGQKYMISSSSKDEKGNPTEVLAYKSDSSEEYKLRFINNKLTEWNREHINRYVVPDQSPATVK